eukprot:11148807-Alexandrium_andersonii.AAC.1
MVSDNGPLRFNSFEQFPGASGSIQLFPTLSKRFLKLPAVYCGSLPWPGGPQETAGRETAGRETAGRETAGRETAGSALAKLLLPMYPWLTWLLWACDAKLREKSVELGVGTHLSGSANGPAPKPITLRRA